MAFDGCDAGRLGDAVGKRMNCIVVDQQHNQVLIHGLLEVTLA